MCRVGHLGWFGPALGPLLLVAAPLLGRRVLVPVPAALPPLVFLPSGGMKKEKHRASTTPQKQKGGWGWGADRQTDRDRQT